MIDASDLVGLTGVAISIYCYARVQWQRDYAKKIDYSLLNLLTSVLLFVPLSEHWNIASFASNMAWTVISLYGVYRCLKYSWVRKYGRKSHEPADPPGLLID